MSAWYRLCAGRDMPTCDTCRRNIENQTRPPEHPWKSILPQIAGKKDCKDYLSQPVSSARPSVSA